MSTSTPRVDWGTPWTEYYGDNFDSGAVLQFASLFYFGD